MLEEWRTFYNYERPHEALGWQTAAERRADHIADTEALPVAAYRQDFTRRSCQLTPGPGNFSAPGPPPAIRT